MIDLRELIAGLTRLMLASDFPDANVIAGTLQLDMSRANVVTMKSGDLLIGEVALDDGAAGADVIAMPPPRREFIVLFRRPDLPYRAIEGKIFGQRQRVQQSKVSDGFAVVFLVEGFEFAITASSPDGAVEALFCRVDPGKEASADTTAGNVNESGGRLAPDADGPPLISGKTALAIAKLVLAESLDAKAFERLAPLQVEDDADVWAISGGPISRKTTRGAAKAPPAVHMRIAKSDGAIVLTTLAQGSVRRRGRP